MIVRDYKYWLGYTQEGTPAEDEWQAYCYIVGFLVSLLVVMCGVVLFGCWAEIKRKWIKCRLRKKRQNRSMMEAWGKMHGLK